jgi:hypothetical protein
VPARAGCAIQLQNLFERKFDEKARSTTRLLLRLSGAVCTSWMHQETSESRPTAVCKGLCKDDA